MIFGGALGINLDDVRKELEGEGIDFATSIQDLSAFNAVLIELPSSRVSDIAGKGLISRRQLRSMEVKLSDLLRRKVEFLVNGDSIRLSYANALEDLLSRKIGQAKYTVVVKLTPLDQCVVWIDARNASVPVSEEEIQAVVGGFLLGIGKRAERVHVMLPKLRRPTDMEILRAIKIASPVAIDELSEKLSGGGAPMIDRKWLSARLDALRKKNLIHRTNGGKYLLTELALSLVPVNRTRKSSDVIRALHLARRKW